MTVLDTSGALDFLVASEAATEVEELLRAEGPLAAPDLLVFEVLAVLRRQVMQGALAEPRADAALEDLGDFDLELFPTLDLRRRAWELRDNLTAADGLFVALAEGLGEPLATKDSRMAAAARELTGIEVVELAREGRG